MHSLRHRMKDKLRNTGCPEAISLAILGHSTNTVAANYGSGYALEVMREHMERVWMKIFYWIFFEMNKARAFNPFLCAKTDKLMALIAEVQVQMSGYEAFHRPAKRAADQLTSHL